MTNFWRKHVNRRQKGRNKYTMNTTNGKKPKRGNYKPRKSKNVQYFDLSQCILIHLYH